MSTPSRYCPSRQITFKRGSDFMPKRNVVLACTLLTVGLTLALPALAADPPAPASASAWPAAARAAAPTWAC